MNIVGIHRFVIETHMPTGKFLNKEIDGHDEDGKPCKLTVPSSEPEYEWMWFCGIGQHPANPKLLGAIWSPYPTQGFQYKDKDEADMVNLRVLGPDAGGIVVEVSKSHWQEGRQIIVPVEGAVVEALSKSGINGARL